MIVYALFTQQSIGRLFAGGIIPGFITATVYAVLIVIRIKINPNLVKSELSDAEKFSLWTRIKAIRELWPAFLTATIVLGGIYGGYFTPTEAAAAGCALMFVLGIFGGSLRSLEMVMIPDGIYALCLPIFFPLIVKLGYDPIWFGIITIKLNEIANVTPPVGLNIFTIQGAMGKDITAEEMYVGVWPFVCCDIVVLIMLITLPDIVLWLPNLILSN